MKYEKIKTLSVGQQCIFLTKDFPKVNGEVLAKRISSFSAALRKDDLYGDQFRIRTLITPLGVTVTRIS